MIVVVGQPLFRVTEAGASADGLPARIALAAAALGRAVQLVGKAGEDPEGDAVVLALAKGGVGHVALLRDAGRPTARATEQPDLDLASPDADRGSDDAAPEHKPAAGATLDAADVDLALRYLTDFAVVVLADSSDPDVVRTVADAASWVGGRLVVVVGSGVAVPDGLPPDAVVLEAPTADPDGVFASFVGSFAAALDAGEEPDQAFHASIGTEGWTPSRAG